MANTGRKIVLTLKKMQNPGNIDTGERKNNVLGDADYIAPTTDLALCPVVYSTSCPVVKFTNNDIDGTNSEVAYEFTLPNAVVTNPTIKKVRTTLLDGITVAGTSTITLPNTPTPNYFAGEFAGTLTATTYTIKIEYLDASDLAIETCV